MEKKHRFRILKTILLFIGMLPVCAVVFVFTYIAGLEDLEGFDPYKISHMSETSVIYDSEGSKLLTLRSKETRTSVRLSVVPRHVIDAFLAVEDTRFYEHQGVDYKRIVGAFINDIRAGSLKEGASTLTQQLIKNTVLNSDKTLKRKLSEAIMAYKLEQIYSKNEILEMYLNYNYFGRGAYGVEQAANLYFGKSVSDLDLNEGATLAGILKSPTRYAPHLDMEKSKSRRDLVLDLMAENNFISLKDSMLEKDKPISIIGETTENYSFFTDYAIDEATKLLNTNIDNLYTQGYRIYTTYNPNVADSVDLAFSEDYLFPQNAPDGEKCEATFVVIDNKSGGISAINGAREYSARFSLNRASSMRRQPGSAIKPIMVYAPALEYLNFSPTTFVLDEPVDYSGYTPP